MRKITVAIVSILVIAGLAALLATMLPKPMSADLSIIGQGRPAVVLVYENYSPTGGDALNRLKQVRADYEARIEFVVADFGAPDGRRFADRLQLSDGQAMFMKPDGTPLGSMTIPADEQALRELLDRKLAELQ